MLFGLCRKVASLGDSRAIFMSKMANKKTGRKGLYIDNAAANLEGVVG